MTIDIYARDLKDFGLEYVNFMTAETSVVKEFGLTLAEKLMKMEFKKRKHDFFDYWRDNKGHFLFQLKDKKQYYVALKKGLYNRIQEIQLEAEEELKRDQEQASNEDVPDGVGEDLQETSDQ